MEGDHGHGDPAGESPATRISGGWGALAALLAAQGADAVQPNDEIEQHWELLSERIVGHVGEDFYLVPRGELPESTTAFDPQPTASLHVVATLTASASASQGYDVQLLNYNDSVVASVPFRGSEATSPTLKTASFAWPTTFTRLEKINVVPVGLTPGILDIHKAYLKIHQAGTVKKTVGRLPMGTRQPEFTSTSWSSIADPLLYTHEASDFSPAPVITLRVTARSKVCGGFRVRLFDVYGNAPVSGSELEFGSTASLETQALSLIDGRLYKVQAQKDLLGCEITTTQSSGGSDPSTPSGDLISADLVFTQSTTDPDGLVRTVG